MHETNFIVRNPLLGAGDQVIGYELAWRKKAAQDAWLNEVDANALLNFVAEQLSVAEIDAPSETSLLFLKASPALIKADAYARLSAQRTVLGLLASDFADADLIPCIKVLRAQGFGISLSHVNLSNFDRSLLSLISHVEISINAPDFDKQVQAYANLQRPSLPVIARDVSTWEQYDTCMSLGLNAFVGTLHLTPRHDQWSKDLNPTQSLILQLMDMVRQSADVNELERLLKRDAALSYKLLRYINSAGFGLGCEVQSLRHAVTLLGYSPLYRWLALLLTTVGAVESPPVLMHTAVVRGRLAELLGHTFLPRREAENLFVAGMFSLLDLLIGIPMEDILEKIQLSEPVTQALLSREGMYGPFLALAEACELNTADVESMATSLCISPSQVNEAHMAALIWAQNLGL